MLTTTDKDRHSAYKKPVAQAYSLSSLRKLEPLVNDVSKLFLDAMHSLKGEPIDLGEWLQWYAFDVIGKITFHQTFGFIENREDKMGMIGDLETWTVASSVLGQVPELHRIFVGNLWMQILLSNTPKLKKLNPFKKSEAMMDYLISSYDSTDSGGRADYLAFLRKLQEKDPGYMTNSQIAAYLGVNMLVSALQRELCTDA